MNIDIVYRKETKRNAARLNRWKALPGFEPGFWEVRRTMRVDAISSQNPK